MRGALFLCEFGAAVFTGTPGAHHAPPQAEHCVGWVRWVPAAVFELAGTIIALVASDQSLISLFCFRGFLAVVVWTVTTSTIILPSATDPRDWQWLSA